MTHLDLSSNLISGPLPSVWQDLENLTHLDLSSNLISGSLPSVWQGLDSLSKLYLSNNMFKGGSLPSVWQGLENLTHLDLSNNMFKSGSLPSVWQGLGNLTLLSLSGNLISGPLPSAWQGLAKLYEFDLSSNLLTGSISMMKGLPLLRVLNLTNNLSGKAEYSWRQLCRKNVVTEITWCVGSLCVPPAGLATLRAYQTSFNTDWRSNACIHPGSREVLFAGMALGGFIIFCMMLTILLYSVYGKPNIEGVQAGGCMRVLFLGIALAKPVMCVVDIVTDALTIAQVWPSSPAYALLGAVFIPNLMVSIAVTVAMMYQCKRVADIKDERLHGSRVDGMVESSLTADSPAWPRGQSAVPAVSCWHRFLRAIGGVAQKGWSSLQTYELAVSRYYLQAIQGIVNEALKVVFCVAYFLGVWLVNLVFVPCWLVIGALCMYSADAEGGAAAAAAEQQRRHGVKGLLKLYDWAVGAVEAPVSAALLIMLLVQGINSSNVYFIENPFILYSSLMFSITITITSWPLKGGARTEPT